MRAEYTDGRDKGQGGKIKPRFGDIILKNLNKTNDVETRPTKSTCQLGDFHLGAQLNFVKDLVQARIITALAMGAQTLGKLHQLFLWNSP